MNWFRNIKIQNKLFMVFGALTAMVIVLAGFAVKTLNSIEAEYARLMEGPLKRHTYISEAAGELKTIRLHILNMGYSAGDSAAIEQYYANYFESADLFLRYASDYDENLDNDMFLPENEKAGYKALITEIRDKFNADYNEYANAVFHAALANDTQLVNSLIKDSLPLRDEFTKNLSSLGELVQKTAVDMSDATQAHMQNSIVLIIIISVSILSAFFVVSILMSGVIKAPIVSMEAAMAEIAKGNLAYPIRSSFRDEMGILSNHIGNMVDTISMLNKTVTIIDNLDDLIFVTDLNYNLIYMNSKASEVYGINCEEAINRKCHKVVYGADCPCSFCPLSKLIPDKEHFPSYDWEQRIQINEKEVWYACKTSIIRWVDGSMAQISTYKDDTLRKEKEEQRLKYEEELREAALAAAEASRMKSVFLATMSHEIRTPMNGIIGFSELALNDSIPSKTRDYLTKIKASSESLMQIINDILDISKIEAGKIELENIPFDLHEVFKLCRIITMPKALEKGITLFCYAEPSTSKRLLGDPTRLRQVLLNLLSNAVKFTNNGIVKLLSAIMESNEKSASILFEIKDSGIGMTPEQIQRIFHPFVQADDSTTRKFGGTGLGLSISKNIIELMGGTLKVESTPGLGSKFSFLLTFETVDVTSDSHIRERTPEILEKPSFEGEVLICEDNEMNQQVIIDHLSRVGLSTVIAANGKIGVECVKSRIESNKKPFDLIFMDIHMPVMDGLEAAKKLEKIGNKSPVVALTANIMPNDREAYHASGMLDCMPKPFKAQELWSCLLKYINPIGMSAVDEAEQARVDDKSRALLITSFVKDNQTTFKDINEAVNSGDIKRAHRLAHTLKGVAGLIGIPMLQEAARVIEHSLAEGKATFTDEQMSILGLELKAALTELEPFTHKQKSEVSSTESFDPQQALALLDKLDLLLESDSFESLNVIEELDKYPGTGFLIEQVEKFEFKQARETLAGLRYEWSDSN